MRCLAKYDISMLIFFLRGGGGMIFENAILSMESKEVDYVSFRKFLHSAVMVNDSY